MQNIMWAWKDYESGKYWHFYPSKKIVEICSPDGFKSQIKNKKGKIVKVFIQEID